MKKAVIVLLAALSFAAAASAQCVDTAAVSDSGRAPSPYFNYTAIIEQDTKLNIGSGYYNSSPVCNINLDYSVIAVKKSATNTTLYLINHSNFNGNQLLPPSAPYIPAKSISVPLPTTVVDFTVNDMYLAGNMMFFCGELRDNLNVQKAFYGYFDASAFISPSSPSLNISVCTLSANTTQSPVSLRKLVAYQTSTTPTAYKVVAIGDDATGYYYGTSKVVEIPGATSIIFPLMCYVADMPNNSVYGQSKKVFLDDIILTDNNVVVLGRELNIIAFPGISHPWFSIGSKANVVSDICNTSNNPSYYLNYSWDANDAVAGVALDNDKFAMAYVYFDQQEIKYYTRLRVIDPVNMTNTYSQQFLKAEKENPVKLVYLKGLYKVELLQPITDSSNFVLLNPCPTVSYTAKMLNPDGREYKSMSRVGLPTNSKLFISTRNGAFYLQDRSITPPYSNTACPSNNNLTVGIIDPVAIINGTFAANRTNYVYLLLSSSSKVSTPTINNKCYSYR